MIAKNQVEDVKKAGSQWKSIYSLGGVTALIVVCAYLLDIVISMMLGGDPSAIPQTAVDRFAQFNSNKLLGLYYLDLLNMTTAIIMIPAFFALCAAHRRVNKFYSDLVMIVFSIGTAVFITNNTALPMLSLSDKYALATTDAQRNLIAAAGEAMLARGAHGSPGVFLGFLLPILASLFVSIVMLRGGIFGKVNAYLGIAGSILLIIYLIMTTFIPDLKNVAMAFATFGGLSTTAWMVLFGLKFLKIRNLRNT